MYYRLLHADLSAGCTKMEKARALPSQSGGAIRPISIRPNAGKVLVMWEGSNGQPGRGDIIFIVLLWLYLQRPLTYQVHVHHFTYTIITTLGCGRNYYPVLQQGNSAEKG
jgi:hypothetical protein